MKQLIAILFIIFPTLLFGQSQFSISMNTGAFFPNSSSFKLGVGGLISFDYHPNNDFTFSLSSGYSTWGYRNTNEYNTRLIPVILGMKYKLTEGSVSTYLSSEFQYIFGEIDQYIDINPENGMRLLNPQKETRNIIDYGIGLGAGVKVPLNANFGLDFGSSILLTAKNSNVYNIRTTVGLSYNF